MNQADDQATLLLLDSQGVPMDTQVNAGIHRPDFPGTPTRLQRLEWLIADRVPGKRAGAQETSYAHHRFAFPLAAETGAVARVAPSGSRSKF